jgi:endonuclease/exonuclease/phosphatase family metal-dependent hydrolase
MTRLTLGTWNLLHGVRVVASPDGTALAGSVDPAALASAAARLDVDLLGLQEVDRCQPRSGSVDQTAVVAAAIGAEHRRFVPALHGTPGAAWHPASEDDGERTDGPTYGVGLVSRRPVRTWHVLRFPASRASLPLMVPGQGLVRVHDEPRVAVAAVLDRRPGKGPMTVATCHLSFVPGVNVAQLRAACRWLRMLPGPRVLIGDLNLPGALPARVSRWSQLARVRTYPSWRPRVQWDHALGDGIEPAAATRVQAVGLALSDHLALLVELEV